MSHQLAEMYHYHWCHCNLAILHSKYLQQLSAILLLRDEYATFELLDLNPEKIVQCPHVHHLELLCEQLLHMCYLLLMVTSIHSVTL